ncbi:hypothetical protein HPB51_002762 [Rhipicephalus microplus]|uniref:Uncharacterized protein n=1 Tax=Rhipicephalus microplus TaxID=6941 RepID=A0A9J6DLI6_RHIMP|nr:hypothetical protein HPB51_002762 [Rhipicephalus microplus]
MFTTTARNTDATFTDLANKFAQSALHLDIGQTYVQPRRNADDKHVELRNQRWSKAVQLNAFTATIPPSYAPQMSCERTETNKQALRQESAGGECVSTTTYITTQGTPAQVQNAAQPIEEQTKVSGQGLGILKQHARNRIQNQHHHPGTDPPQKTEPRVRRDQNRHEPRSQRPLDRRLRLKASWAAGPPSLKSSLPNSSHQPSSHNHLNVPLTSNAVTERALKMGAPPNSGDNARKRRREVKRKKKKTNIQGSSGRALLPSEAWLRRRTSSPHNGGRASAGKF